MTPFDTDAPPAGCAVLAVIEDDPPATVVGRHRNAAPAEVAIGIVGGQRLAVVAWDKKLAPIFKAAQPSAEVGRKPADDVILILGGVHLMSGVWSGAKDFPGVPNVNHCLLRKLPDHIRQWMDDAQLSRILVTNLSARLRQFHQALAEVHMMRDEAKTAKRKRK